MPPVFLLISEFYGRGFDLYFVGVVAFAFKEAFKALFCEVFFDHGGEGDLFDEVVFAVGEVPFYIGGDCAVFANGVAGGGIFLIK